MATEKKYTMIGTQEIMFVIVVSAKNKTEAMKKARAGEIESSQVKYQPKGFCLSGAGSTTVTEI